ncbi:lmo0937 family membrane protein [Solitalea sp. MAHUQ-68]|uniref:Lmo0937 family membrane protein n=1 Tax=Solitalea agri TaxID=2953739 RepID=A0A9X2JEE4_9SPHI|nr:lmo0937 family membrane protein [Solitalea agri]MCO4294654.1 lmo0937 family membrane protein [Solitalea agri]
MRSILYVLAVILVVGWLLGLTVWHAGGIIHILLVLAVISILFTLIRSNTNA